MNLDGSELNDSFGLNPSALEFIPKTPPQRPPSILLGAQTNRSISPLDSIWNDSQSANPQRSKKLVKFVQNVHFPKDFLNDCLKVLPPDVALADVKYQPENFQERWFDYLEQRELKTVKKCEVTSGATEEATNELSSFDSVIGKGMESQKPKICSSVSKNGREEFVSSLSQIELDGRINKKFEDLSFFSSDFKEEFTELSVDGDSKVVQLQPAEASCSYKFYP